MTLFHRAIQKRQNPQSPSKTTRGLPGGDATGGKRVPTGRVYAGGAVKSLSALGLAAFSILTSLYRLHKLQSGMENLR